MNIQNPRKRIGQEGFTLVELMIVVAIIGILAVLAIFGVSKYVTNAKTGEARNSLGMIGKASVQAYQSERAETALINPGSLGAGVSHGLCITAAPVPAAIPANQKYQSSNADWFPATDTPNTGWTCLKYQMTEPQYFQYGYESDSTATTKGSGFVSYAQSDLEGAGAATLSFELNGGISATTGQVVLAPQIKEINGAATKTKGSVP